MGDPPALTAEDDPAQYHTATEATMVFMAPHAAEVDSAISLWVIRTCVKFKVEHCRAAWQHVAKLCRLHLIS